MYFRPRNETPKDLANEEEAAQVLKEAWKVEVCKLSETLYRIDWALSRDNRVCAFAEFKTRSKKLGSLMISMAKYMHMVQIHRFTGLPTFLIVKWPDGYWYHEVAYVEQLPLDVRIGGNSRGQNGDIEPVIYIPVREFKQIKAS